MEGSFTAVREPKEDRQRQGRLAENAAAKSTAPRKEGGEKHRNVGIGTGPERSMQNEPDRVPGGKHR